jgi:hypothetical protein
LLRQGSDEPLRRSVLSRSILESAIRINPQSG